MTGVSEALFGDGFSEGAYSACLERMGMYAMRKRRFEPRIGKSAQVAGRSVPFRARALWSMPSGRRSRSKHTQDHHGAIVVVCGLEHSGCVRGDLTQ